MAAAEASAEPGGWLQRQLGGSSTNKHCDSLCTNFKLSLWAVVVCELLLFVLHSVCAGLECSDPGNASGCCKKAEPARATAAPLAINQLQHALMLSATPPQAPGQAPQTVVALAVPALGRAPVPVAPPGAGAAAAAAPATPNAFCSNCGLRSAGANFCPGCGQKM